MIRDFWDGLPLWSQDLSSVLACLLPLLVVGLWLLQGFAPWPLVRAMLSRFRWTNALFVGLIAVSVGMGIGLIAQERGLRQGAARAADKFDLVVSAPGSEMTMLLASVFLQPSDVPLLDGEIYDRIARTETVEIAAPLAYGDSYNGAPVVGTIADFVTYLSDDRIEGRRWQAHDEAVVGARVDLAVGDSFTPAHGHGATAEEDAHDHSHFEVAGRMALTGTPWDRAILVPVEAVWEVHGLSNGHAPERQADHDHAEAHPGEHDHEDGHDPDHAQGHGEDPAGDHGDEAAQDHEDAADLPEGHDHGDRHGDDHGAEPLGPPFDPAYFPGTPAVVVKAEALWANYALRDEFTEAGRSMAFFPATVLTQLYAVMGDVRQAMSILSAVTQVLVAAAVLTGLMILGRLFRRQIAMLRALGAPRRFVMAVVWSQASALLIAGTLLGVVLGVGATAGLSQILSARTDMLIRASLGWDEIRLAAIFLSVTSVLSLLPALSVLRAPISDGLRS